ncbi:MAG: protein-methionine-sulfoxide reductase catalytic subunit MsrP [Opitutales bacterium]
MHYLKQADWQLPESAVTLEADYRARRRFLKTAGLGLASASLLRGTSLRGATAGFPSEPNPAYRPADLKPTPYDAVTQYNNFYEFGFGKDEPAVNANQGWETEPWTIRVEGKVNKPQTFDVNPLVKTIGIEQRIYRFRCVEAWSMVVPWDGFPLASLLAKVEPKRSAKFVAFTTALDREHMVGLRQQPRYPWPYTEGLRIDEAMHPLTFLATGIYGKPIPNQNGAPIRLVVPWKYGFKSIKSIVKISLTDRQPDTLWNQLAPNEYGFYANVNPNVDHPRWSQARERPIGAGFFAGKKPTLLFNGYTDQVASLYEGMDLRKFF